MDKPFRQQGTDAQQASSFSIILGFFNSTLHWLIGLIQVTEEEQRDAGIYLGNRMTEEEQRDAGIYLGDEPYK